MCYPRQISYKSWSQVLDSFSCKFVNSKKNNHTSWWVLCVYQEYKIHNRIISLFESSTACSHLRNLLLQNANEVGTFLTCLALSTNKHIMKCSTRCFFSKHTRQCFMCISALKHEASSILLAWNGHSAVVMSHFHLVKARVVSPSYY